MTIPNTTQAERQSTLNRLAELANTARNAVTGVFLTRDHRNKPMLELALNSAHDQEAMKIAQAISEMFEAPLARRQQPPTAGDSPELEQSQYHSKPAHTFYARERKSAFSANDKSTLDRIAKGLDFKKPSDRSEYRQRIIGMARLRNLPLDPAGRLADRYIAERVED